MPQSTEIEMFTSKMNKITENGIKKTNYSLFSREEWLGGSSIDSKGGRINLFIDEQKLIGYLLWQS